MLLPADGEAPAQPVRRGGQRGAGIAARHGDGRQHEAVRGHGLVEGEDGGQQLDVQHHPPRRVARGLHRVGHHQGDHLPGVVHVAVGQDGLVVRRRGQPRVAGDVGGQHHGAHAGVGQRGRHVDAAQAAVRHGREHGRGVQRAARLGQVVDVGRRALHVGVGAFMRVGCAAGGAGQRGVGQRGVHGRAPASMGARSARAGPAPGCIRAPRRRSRLPSMCRR